MTDYLYGPFPAIDGMTGLPVSSAAGQIFAIDDTALTTPLTVRDLAGVATTDVRSTPNSLVTAFVIADRPEGVIWASGQYRVPLVPFRSLVEEALAARLAAEAAADEAAGATGSLEAVQALAQAAADSAAAAAAAASNTDGTAAAGGTNPIRFRWGTPAEWEAANPVLLRGQPGLSIDESVTPTVVVMKIGNGTDPWNLLDDQISGGGSGGGNWSSSSFTALGFALATSSGATAARSSIGLGNLYFGNGSPEGSLAAPVGSLYFRSDGSVGATLYVKESGVGATGWYAKAAATTKASLGLDAVDNTSDASKPVSTAQAAALAGRASRVYYDGSSWPTRPADAPAYGLDWVSTAHVAAPSPAAGASAGHDGDLWWRHPAAV